MRWPLREKVYPKLGDTRTKLRFAFLPMRCGKEYVWLERVLVTETYREVFDPFIGGLYDDWAVSARAPNMHHLGT